MEPTEVAVKEVVLLVALIIQSLVDNPKAVRVTPVFGSLSVILEVVCDQSDYGKVVGRNGRTANAIREILTDIGGRMRRRFILELLETRSST